MPGTVVQSKSVNVTGSGPVVSTITLDSPTTAGNALVAVFSAYDTGVSPGWPYVNDAYNSWQPGADQWSWTSFSGVVQVQYALNIAARASHSFGVEVPNCEYYQVFVMEVSGVKAPTAIEINNVAEAQGSGPTGRSGQVIPTVASFLVAAITEDTGTLVDAVSAGWTERYDGNVGQPLHVATRSGAAATAAECLFTYAATSNAAGVILGLEEVAGGVTESAALAVAGASSIAVSARRARAALATIAAVSSLAVAARRTRAALAAIAGQSSVQVAGRSTRRAAVTIAGSGSIALGASVTEGPREYGAVTIAGTSSVAANATSKRRTTVAIAGASQIAVAGLSFGPRRAALVIVGSGRVGVGGLKGGPGRGTTSIVVEAWNPAARRAAPQGTTRVGGIE